MYRTPPDPVEHRLTVHASVHGFFVHPPMVAREEEPAFIVVPGLREPVQFFRPTITSNDGGSTDHVILSAYYPAWPAAEMRAAARLLHPICEGASLSFIVENRPGWSRIACYSDAPAFLVAAAVAFTKVSGGWDESQPIVVEVGEDTFEVFSEYLDRSWHCTVKRINAESDAELRQMTDTGSPRKPFLARVTHRFAASAERVYDAFLDLATARRFLYANPAGQIVRAELDPRVGGAYVFTDRRGGIDVEHHGTYLELDRPRRLVFTMFVPGYSTSPDRVTVEIAPTGSGCELTLMHEMGEEHAPFVEATVQAYTEHLELLDAVLSRD